MAQGWGVSRGAVAEPKDSGGQEQLGDSPAAQDSADQAPVARKNLRLTPTQAQKAHRGIVWLHVMAVAMWIVVALAFVGLYVSGRHIPIVIVAAPIIIALGHGLFIAVHLLFESMARKRVDKARAN